MIKWLLKSKVAVMGIAAAALVAAVGVPALASNIGALQEGFQQGGNADSAQLKIRVEASLPADASLYPDETQQVTYPNGTPVYSNCAPSNSFGSQNPDSFPQCEGAPLSLTITNETSHPLRITGVVQSPPFFGPGVQPIGSDRQVSGMWSSYLGFDPPNTPAGTGSWCSTFAYFVAPQIQADSNNLGQKQLPLIPPHETLTIPTAGGAVLAYIHLQVNTPTNCMGASYQVPLTVTAVPSNF